jgi:hypothetical protein
MWLRVPDQDLRRLLVAHSRGATVIEPPSYLARSEQHHENEVAPLRVSFRHDRRRADSVAIDVPPPDMLKLVDTSQVAARCDFFALSRGSKIVVNVQTIPRGLR